MYVEERHRKHSTLVLLKMEEERFEPKSVEASRGWKDKERSSPLEAPR
jgi:hypothetical protein